MELFHCVSLLHSPLRFRLAFREARVLFARHFRLRRHRHTRADALQAVDDDLFACLQAGANDALAVHIRAELHGLIRHRVRRLKREHKFLRLVGADGAFLDEQRRVARRSAERGCARTIRAQSGRPHSEIPRAAECCRCSDQAGCRTIRCNRGAGNPSSSASCSSTGILPSLARLKLFGLGQRVEFEQRILVDVRIDIDRVHGDDRGQRRSTLPECR